MHALFETAMPSFGYMSSGSLSVLKQLRDFWNVEGDGPLVTMDAGPNVHCLLRTHQEGAYQGLIKQLSRDFRVIRSHP